MRLLPLSGLLMSSVLVVSVSGHGLMLSPISRNARDGLLTPGGTMWFSQGCSIGCQKCNGSAPISAHALGDLCPTDTSGNKTPVVNGHERTYAQAAPTEPADQDFTRFHPWRRPGSVPGLDPCGIAGGAFDNRSFAAGGFGYTTGYKQGFLGSNLPPITEENRAVWRAGATAEVSWVR